MEKEPVACCMCGKLMKTCSDWTGDGQPLCAICNVKFHLKGMYETQPYPLTEEDSWWEQD